MCVCVCLCVFVCVLLGRVWGFRVLGFTVSGISALTYAEVVLASKLNTSKHTPLILER